MHFVMQDGVFTQPDHRVTRVALRKSAPDDYVAGLDGLKADFTEAIGRHVFQVKVFAADPPAVASLEVRQIDAAEMIGVSKKRVAVRHAVLEASAQQVRHRTEFAKAAVAG